MFRKCFRFISHIFVVCIYRCLIDHGADVAAVNNEGELPLDLAEEEDMEDLLTDEIERLGKCSVLRLNCMNSCRRDYVESEGVFTWYTRVTFVPAQVHPGFLLWLCICLHDTTRKCHTRMNHTGASSTRLLYQSRVFKTRWQLAEFH